VLAAAAVGGVALYATGATVALTNTSDQVITAAPDGTTAATTGRTDRGSAVSRSGRGDCSVTGPGQGTVEDYLSVVDRRFGAVSADNRQSPGDCLAIKQFQTWAQLPNPSGFADLRTADVAGRLAVVDTTSCQAQSGQTTICVDLTRQIVWGMQRGSITFRPVPARTGRKGLDTPIGRYTISEKKVRTVSTEYGTSLPYWEGFYRDFGFHGAETSLYSDDGSHGCVTLILRDARSLFGYTKVGTVVRVFGSRPAS
jgi:hypothetical protein